MNTYCVLSVNAADVMDEGRLRPRVTSRQSFLLITSTRPPLLTTSRNSAYRSSVCFAIIGMRLIGVPIDSGQSIDSINNYNLNIANVFVYLFREASTRSERNGQLSIHSVLIEEASALLCSAINSIEIEYDSPKSRVRLIKKRCCLAKRIPQCPIDLLFRFARLIIKLMASVSWICTYCTYIRV